MTKIKLSFAIGVFWTTSVANAAMAATTPAQDQLFQVATLYALENGLFNGDYPYQSLMSRGTLGIGTFNAIDGEMIAIEGKYYQSTPDCHLRPVAPELIAPFAEVIDFQPEVNFSLNHLESYPAFSKRLVQKFPNPNVPYAIHMTGLFNSIKVRSLTKQTPPFSSLLKASKKQGILELKNVKGDAVGFWFPAYWEGIGMPGVHLHFASADRQFGGHVLALNIADAQVQLQPVHNIQVYLPSNPEFIHANMVDPDTIEADLLEVEGEPSR